MKKRSVLYLDRRGEEAFKALVKNLRDKVISYQELGTMAEAFGLQNAGKVRDIVKRIKVDKPECWINLSDNE